MRHRKGRLHLVLILPEGSKSLIPADWTDLPKPTQLGSESTVTTSEKINAPLTAGLWKPFPADARLT